MSEGKRPDFETFSCSMSELKWYTRALEVALVKVTEALVEIEPTRETALCWTEWHKPGCDCLGERIREAIGIAEPIVAAIPAPQKESR